MLSKLQALPYKTQMPSYCVAEMRTWLPALCQRETDAYIAWPGRTYPRRLGKPVAIWSIGGAAAPAQSEFLSSGAMWGLSRLRPVSRFRSVKLPYMQTPVSSWALLGAACVLVGTSGAPKFNDETQPGCVHSDTAGPAAPFTPTAHDSAHGADLRVNLPDTRLQQWVESAINGLGQVAAHGLLGLSQMALDAEGLRRADLGQNRLAWACRAGATALLCAMEPVRFALQVIYLGLELALALPFAAAGALVGVGVFLCSMHVDPWAEVRDGMAMA